MRFSLLERADDRQDAPGPRSRPRPAESQTAMTNSNGTISPSGVVRQVSSNDLEAALAADVTGLVAAFEDALRDHVRTTQSCVFGRIQDVLIAASREATTTELIERAPAALCDAGGFDQALVSVLRGSTWVPEAGHAASAGPDGSRADIDALRGIAVPLKPGLWETEVVRRRVPVLVRDAHADPKTFGPFVALVRASEYVAAPIVVDGRVIGLVHAYDVGPGRRLDTMARESAKIFADGLGLAYERAALAESVVRQRERLERAFSSVGSVLGELECAAVRLTRSRTGATVGYPLSGRSSRRAAHRDDELLTPREHEILALMATGATNRQIAIRLFVSESTVKSHVKRILRSLPAANRAEAVYRYKRIAGGRNERS